MLRLGFRPSVPTWTLVALAYLSVFAHIALGGHPADETGSFGDHRATLALLAAAIAMLGSLASAALDAFSARRASRSKAE